MKYPMGDAQEMNLPLGMWRRAGDLIFVSGHGAVNGAGEFVGNSFEEQFAYTLSALKKTLAEAGVGLEHVVSVRSYVRDPANLPLYNRLYREQFAAPFPARTTVTNCLPEGLEFEIECVADASLVASQGHTG